MPYTFSQHVPWWNEIANQVVDLSGNPISGTIPAGSSVITGSTNAGLHAVTSGSFGPAPVSITANVTANINITVMTTGVLINADTDLIEAILLDRDFEDGFDPIEKEVFI